jgi:surfeit locus 1 family protein
VLVNRGFLATPRGDGGAETVGGATSAVHAPVAALGIALPAAPPGGQVTVAGLLRITEPGGAFLRHNAPEQERWYSRDVAAIGSTLGLRPNDALAPYFIDAEAAATGSRPSGSRVIFAGPASEPIGGMTVIHFHNSHLLYAITWYTLALMSAWATWRVGRPEDEAPTDDGDVDPQSSTRQNTH